MNTIIYRSTRSLYVDLKNSYNIIKKNIDDQYISDNFIVIRSAYLSIKNTLKSMKELPINSSGQIRIFEYAKEFFSFNKKTLNIPELISFFSSLSDKVNLNGDEISAIPDICKLLLVIDLADIVSTPSNDDSSTKANFLLTSLRKLNEYNFEGLYETLSKCEPSLNKDKLYVLLNKRSKDVYRHKITLLAKKYRKDEIEIVNDLIEKTSNFQNGKKSTIGYYLLKHNYGRKLYFPAIILILLLLLIPVHLFSNNIFITLFSIIPSYYISKLITERIFSFSGSPYITRLDLKAVPKTLVTITTLISNEKDVDILCEKCLQYMYSNKTEGLIFGFLADIPKSLSPITPKDNLLTEYASKKINELNLLYGNRFFCAIRKKTSNHEDGTFQGKERKRGAIEDFLFAVENHSTDDFTKIVGDIYKAKYFAALDDDTKPDIDSITQLVSVLENPLYEPKINSEKNIVSDGYAIAVPKIESELDSVMYNTFTKIFGGKAGSEMYDYPIFNVYNDIFDESIFSGKGVINISVFNRVLNGILGNGSVLSHDIIEGSFLRTILVSDVVFYDKTPKNILSYNTRNDRWIRGDWQNIRFLCNKIKIADNSYIRNPISALSKFKILDNLLRSLSDPCTFILIFLSAITMNYIPLAVAIIYLFRDMISETLSLLAHPYRVLPLKYKCGALTNIQRVFLQNFSSLVFLPYISFTNIKAIVKSLYRMIRKKKLLEWKTSDQVDSDEPKTINYIKNMAFQLCGLLLLINLRFIPITVLWLIAIPYAMYLSKKRQSPIYDHESDSVMKAMWKYFEDHLTEINNYLPPDNYQEKPLGMYADRTSPTNIGLTVLTILGAYDIGVITEERLYFLLDKILSSVETLETYKGHLFNWYEITTKKTLYPRYISTVDSGNFICCLFTLKNGLKEFNTTSAALLINRLDKIINNTDFSFLYDNQRNLFVIGYDYENQIFSKSYYDLYASESRLTSYYAIATGQVPKKHWNTLSRPTIISKSGIGVKSWSGTAFEYLMPHLLLPMKKGSFSHESVLFSISEQIRRTNNLSALYNGSLLSIPWGISESCYYTLGTDLSYQYKAFGVDKLALDQNSDTQNEIVISPYSTLMSLPYDYRNSVKNLNLLFEYNSRGKYGYYESIDFHKTANGYMPKTVSTFMVHHIGMSFLSLLNMKQDNIMQKRFMDTQMKAYEILLDERPPEFDSNFNEKDYKKSQFKYEKYKTNLNESNVMNPFYPHCKAISDGKTTVWLTNCGESVLKHENIDITNYDKREYNGIFAFLKIDNNILPFSYAPLCDDTFKYDYIFNDGYVQYNTKWKNFELTQKITILPESECEIREYVINNNSNIESEAEMLIYFEPVLMEHQNYISHPAFNDLFIEAKKDDKKLTFIRRNRTDGTPRFKLDIFFDSDLKYDFELSKFNILETNGGKESLIKAFDIEFSNSTQGPVSPCAAIRLKIKVNTKQEKHIKLFLSFGKEPEYKSLTDPDIFNNSSEDNAYILMKEYKKNNIHGDVLNFYDYILSILMTKKSLKNNSLKYKNTLSRAELWKLGISGDNPIILFKTDETNIEKCSRIIKSFVLLKNRNIDVEFVFCFTEDNGYRRNIITKLTSYISECGLNHYLGENNGIFLVNTDNISIYSLLCSVAVYVFDLNFELSLNFPNEKFKKSEIKDVSPVKMNYLYKTGIGGFNKNGFVIDDKKLFNHKPPWCNIHAHKDFGTMLSDSSLGFTYAKNSYKNKLTPWYNNVTKDNNGEKIYLVFGKGKNKRIYDLIKNSSVVFNENYSEYFAEAENVYVSVKVFVPDSINAKVIKAHIENSTNENIRLVFEANIIMNDFENVDTVNCTRINNILYFTNPYNTEFKNGTVFLFGHGMRPEGEKLVGTIYPESSEDKTIVLGYETSENSAKSVSELLNENKILEEEAKLSDIPQNDIIINTPSQELNLLYNTFLKNQIVKCRLYAKTGFYQCSGAIGFRDQLQDSICISTINTEFLKQQILINAEHQFLEGDVMHWFHIDRSSNGKICGVRTKSSDDLLWLAYAVCEYTEKTGDLMYLTQRCNYLKAPELAEYEDEKYIEAELSDEDDTIYGHCKRAIKKGTTKGTHGLVNFGSGDWNDGLNKLNGGETVWGTFFIIIVLERFSSLCKKVKDTNFEALCLHKASEYRLAIDKYAWSDDRYIRGYFPSGNTLGDKSSSECKIDIISQSFSAICGGFNNERVRTALETAEKYLVDKQKGIVKLFTPPFNKCKETPGYIIGYIPGIRENGGQYTHASIWYALALFRIGEYEKAFEILDIINPINHSKTLDDIKTYRTEPYVLSADVYTNEAHYGMGGWSWYTGSAGWFFKVVTEELLGIILKENSIIIRPKIPTSWHKFSAEIKKDGTTISLTAIQPADNSYSGKLFVDNIESDSVPLNGKDHEVIYYL